MMNIHIPDFFMDIYWHYPWALVVAISVICIIFVLFFPIPFEYWETDWEGLSVFILFVSSIPFVFAGLYWGWEKLTPLNFTISIIMFLSAGIITAFRCVFRMAKNYPFYSNLLEKIIKEQAELKKQRERLRAEAKQRRLKRLREDIEGTSISEGEEVKQLT